ncbi:magnesium transporter [Anaeromyxobacter sp. Fw109-5]|uniref:magnesium transporter n=1 Tax=Anaeromyxobacter sp. (strain Fw109-5) TaxID=404589 RepID=UPI0000ED7BDF|nr:magnesium transporter [Anaeromyxobacter sp. Fw109-5]ABS24300.1 magnesium transporter [Anaeromyxobacter sp. Fw109-5]
MDADELVDVPLTAEELRDAWPALSWEERIEGFHRLVRAEADDFFLELPPADEAALLLALPPPERRLWIRLLAPDDAADVIQETPEEERPRLIELLDPVARREVTALLAYAEDAAGGLMSPRFARLRPEMTADEAIRYLRRQAREQAETIYYAYVLDPEQKLSGVVSFRDLLTAPPDRRISELMKRDVVSVPDTLDQEAVARIMAREDINAIPVVDGQGRMQGIVTVDDVVDVVQQEATEDIQKIGGTEALDAPYLDTGLFAMVKKRAGWLALLFVGEMMTASAMGRFEEHIASAVVLALFVPLIISSGGNSGSQASTLVIRAMALGEVGIADAWRVARREILSGLVLGGILAVLGVVRIFLWQGLFGTYGHQAARLALTVGSSVIAVVTFGTIAGSMMPLLIRRLGFDPASASAPFIATMVDVSGVVIYFSMARLVLL